MKQWLPQANAVKIVGDLTYHTVQQIWLDIQTWSPESDQVTVELSEIKQIDSSGVALLICMIEYAAANKCHVLLSCVSERLRTLFQLSNKQTLIDKHIIV